MARVRIPYLPFDKFSLLARITDQEVSEPSYSGRGQRRYESIVGVGPMDEQRWLPLRGYLMAIAIFCNEVKGKAALAISRDLGLSYKTAFVLLHKFREAMAEEMKCRKLGGDGKVAEIDGGYFGRYVKPTNQSRRDRRLARNQTGKRKTVVIIRERNGRSLTAVFRTEGQALSFIRAHRQVNDIQRGRK